MTATPRDVIERLHSLQDLDRKIAALDREIVAGPKAVESFARAVAAADQKIAALDERSKLLKAQVKLRENEAKTAIAKVDRLNDQARGVKTNREFTVIRSEIANAKLDVGKLEDEILKIMEAVEVQEKAIATAKEERAREQRRLDAERTKVDAALDGIKKSRADLAALRPAAITGVTAETLAIYDRVATARGNGLAALEQDFCSGCMERVTRNEVLAIHNAIRIVQCKSCGRILYSP